MASERSVTGRNVMVSLGLWLCFACLTAVLAMVWGRAFVVGRIFTGPYAGLQMSLLSLPAYIACGLLIGFGVSRLIRSPRLLAWSVVLGVLFAVADLASLGGVQHRGADALDMSLRIVAIAGSVVLGCWLGMRRQRVERADASA
jgi:hypothetical protein